ncbi:MAG TPA: phosphoribosyltransferase [Stellaceae bacterium]|nr:phosphoribosyltransferase [Stellaceae bacterium]
MTNSERFVEFKDAFFQPSLSQVKPSRQQCSLTQSLVYRPTIFRRNQLRWMSVYRWKAGCKADGLAALKRAKTELDPKVIDEAALSLAALICELFGDQPADGVTNVPCGHSRRTDCFGKRLAQAVAAHLQIKFVQIFADRPLAGVSHPKESAKVTPLRRIGTPPGFVFVVDDLATSGQHLEESTLALRQLGVTASAMAWISGVVQGETSYPSSALDPITVKPNEDVILY